MFVKIRCCKLIKSNNNSESDVNQNVSFELTKIHNWSEAEVWTCRNSERIRNRGCYSLLPRLLCRKKTPTFDSHWKNAHPKYICWGNQNDQNLFVSIHQSTLVRISYHSRLYEHIIRTGGWNFKNEFPSNVFHLNFTPKYLTKIYLRNQTTYQKHTL